MKSFILPGGSEAGSRLHYARTLCRKTEREVIWLKEQEEVVPELAIQYLNRLNDALFVFARHINALEKCEEDPWI
jgi:cob(I)alamin adenosyltransferase